MEKIPAELISINSRDLAEVNVEKLHQTLEERKAKKYLKPSKIEFEPKNKMKGRSGTVKRFHIKRTVQEEQKWVCFFNIAFCTESFLVLIPFFVNLYKLIQFLGVI